MSQEIPLPTSPRIAPVDTASITDPEFAAALQKTLLRDDGKPVNIFATLAHHPKLLDRFNRMGGFLLQKGLLPPREREIVILRVGWKSRSVYEFGQHTIIGQREGITTEEVSALTKSPSEHPWSSDDTALIALADELCDHNVVSDATWAQLRTKWNEAEMVEMVITAGFYRLVSGFLNTMGVQLDPGVPTWPE
jgi:4-carboxymuconolactone decarboxylase